MEILIVYHVIHQIARQGIFNRSSCKKCISFVIIGGQRVTRLDGTWTDADSDDFIERVFARGGVIISMGHTAATYEQAVKAIKKGVTHVTHGFNAMTPLHHREPGVVGAFLTENLYVEIIPDGIHIKKELFPLLIKTVGLKRIILITDSMRAAGMEEGEYTLGGNRVFADRETARLKDGTLAGSILSMNRGVANFMLATGIELWQAVHLASLNPARELGIDEKTGSLEEGKLADIVIADEELNVYTTIIEGKKVYENPAE